MAKRSRKNPVGKLVKGSRKATKAEDLALDFIENLKKAEGPVGELIRRGLKDANSHGRRAYETYCSAMGGVTARGDKCLPWSKLGKKVQGAWTEAAAVAWAKGVDWAKANYDPFTAEFEKTAKENAGLSAIVPPARVPHIGDDVLFYAEDKSGPYAAKIVKVHSKRGGIIVDEDNARVDLVTFGSGSIYHQFDVPRGTAPGTWAFSEDIFLNRFI